MSSNYRQDAAGNVRAGWVLRYDDEDRTVRSVRFHEAREEESERQMVIRFDDGTTARGDEGQTVYVVTHWEPEEAS